AERKKGGGGVGAMAVAQPTAGNIEEGLNVAASVKGLPFPFDAVVGALLKAGNKVLVLDIAQPIKDLNQRDRAQSGFASALAKAGEIGEAVALARLIAGEATRAEALGNVAMIAAQAGQGARPPQGAPTL